MKRRTLIILIISIITVLFGIWYLCGMPGGWIPGKYNSETRSYNFLTGGNITARNWDEYGVSILVVKSPLGSPDSIFMKSDTYGVERKIFLQGPWARYGLIDSTGKVLEPFVYDYIKRNVGDKCFLLGKDSLCGVYNYSTKKMVIPMEYKGIKYSKSRFNQQNNPPGNKQNETGYYKYYLLQGKNNLFGLADSTGKIVVPCQYRYRNEHYSYISFTNEKHPDGSWPDVYDYTGKKFFSGEYEHIIAPHPGIPFFEARKNNKDYYFIDAQTMKKQKTGFIPVKNQSSKFDSLLLVHGIYSDSIHHTIQWSNKSTTYSHNKIIAQDNREYNIRWGIADYLGNLLLPLEYDSISRTRHDLLFVKKGEKQGLLNLKMEWVVPLKNYQLKIHKMPLIRIYNNNKPDETYCIDLNGTIIMSKNIEVHNFYGGDNDMDYVYFSLKKRKGVYYKLKYDKKEECFFWHRDK